MTRKQLFDEFYKFFKKNSNSSYSEIHTFLFNKYTISILILEKNVDNLRRYLQRMGILQCQRHMSGKGNISTTKTFDEERVKKYKEYLDKKERKVSTCDK